LVWAWFFLPGYGLRKPIIPVSKNHARPIQFLKCKHSDSELKPKSETFGIREYQDKYFDNPEIELIVPLDDNEFVYLQINFLEYQVNLPFHFVPSVLSNLIYSKMPDFGTRLPVLQKSGSFLYFPIKQTKLGGIESFSDYLLGKPIRPT